MSRKLTSMLVVLAGFLLVALVPTVAMAEAQHGTIKSVDAAQNQLVLTVNGEDKTFTVAEGCQISLDGEEAQLGDLKAGQTATVSAEQKDGAMMATRIVANGSR